METIQLPLRQRQLFLDDCGIAKIENLERTLHQPVKKGAVIRVDYLAHPGITVQTRTAPVWDPDRRSTSSGASHWARTKATSRVPTGSVGDRGPG